MYLNKRDSRKSRLYRWEYRVLPDVIKKYGKTERHFKFTLAGCKFLIDEAITLYNNSWMIPPNVVKGRKNADATATRVEVSLPEWAHVPAVVLHEVAHTIHINLMIDNYISADQAAHGPEFCRIFAILLSKYYKVPVGKITKSMRKAGCKVAGNLDWLQPPNSTTLWKKKQLTYKA